MPGITEETTPPTHEFLLKFQTNFEKRFIELLNSQWELFTKTLRDSWLDVDEYNYNANSTQVIVPPQSSNPVNIDTIVAYCGPNDGLVTLGDRQIPIPAATIQSIGGRWRLSAQDKRMIQSVTLTSGSPGNPVTIGEPGLLYLELFGKEIPYGAISA